VLVCSDMDGSEKMSLLVIGKSEKPRWLKHVKSLPHTYRHNSIWILCVLFMVFLTSLESRMAAKKHKILLFLYQCVLPPLTMVYQRSVYTTTFYNTIKRIRHYCQHLFLFA
jgi:hypothetical protein